MSWINEEKRLNDLSCAGVSGGKSCHSEYRNHSFFSRGHVRPSLCPSHLSTKRVFRFTALAKVHDWPLISQPLPTRLLLRLPSIRLYSISRKQTCKFQVGIYDWNLFAIARFRHWLSHGGYEIYPRRDINGLGAFATSSKRGNVDSNLIR